MNWKKGTRERVITAIQNWSHKVVAIGKIWQKDCCLCAIAFKVFGSWRATLAVAGLHAALVAAGPKPTRKRSTKDRVTEKIRIGYRRGSALNSGIVFKQNAPLAGAGTRSFGGWGKAVAAAELQLNSGTYTKTKKTA
jgi:hypothetical protein